MVNIIKEQHLETCLWLPKPPKEIFPFFSDAFNLELLTPLFLRFEVMTPRPIIMKCGTKIKYKLSLRGIPMRWTSLINYWDPPFKFVDQQISGPFLFWNHEHMFEPMDGGCLVRDKVQYKVLGGSLANKLIVFNDLQKIFDYRRLKLKVIFEKDSSFYF